MLLSCLRIILLKYDASLAVSGFGIIFISICRYYGCCNFLFFSLKVWVSYLPSTSATIKAWFSIALHHLARLLVLVNAYLSLRTLRHIIIGGDHHVIFELRWKHYLHVVIARLVVSKYLLVLLLIEICSFYLSCHSCSVVNKDYLLVIERHLLDLRGMGRADLLRLLLTLRIDHTFVLLRMPLPSSIFPGALLQDSRLRVLILHNIIILLGANACSMYSLA